MDDVLTLMHYRASLRRFNSRSQELCRQAGVTEAEYRLLLAVGASVRRGARDPIASAVAMLLGVRPSTLVETVARARDSGLVRKGVDPDDARAVKIGLTARGERVLGELAARHVEEWRRFFADVERRDDV